MAETANRMSVVVKFFIFCAIILFHFEVPANAAEITVFKLDSRVVSGLVLKDGKVFVDAGRVSETGLADGSEFNALIVAPPNGKTNCRKTKFVDVGVEYETKTCVSVTKKGKSYLITSNDVFTFDPYFTDDPASLQVLKDYDFVQSRKILIEITPNGRKCSATALKRSYVPVKGNKSRPSSIGPLACNVTSNNL